MPFVTYYMEKTGDCWVHFHRLLGSTSQSYQLVPPVNTAQWLDHAAGNKISVKINCADHDYDTMYWHDFNNLKQKDLTFGTEIMKNYNWCHNALENAEMVPDA